MSLNDVCVFGMLNVKKKNVLGMLKWSHVTQRRLRLWYLNESTRVCAGVHACVQNQDKKQCTNICMYVLTHMHERVQACTHARTHACSLGDLSADFRMRQDNNPHENKKKETSHKRHIFLVVCCLLQSANMSQGAKTQGTAEEEGKELVVVQAPDRVGSGGLEPVRRLQLPHHGEVPLEDDDRDGHAIGRVEQAERPLE